MRGWGEGRGTGLGKGRDEVIRGERGMGFEKKEGEVMEGESEVEELVRVEELEEKAVEMERGTV